TPEALAVLRSKDAADLFNRYRVLSPRELQARADILLDQYVTTVAIEGRTMLSLLRTHVLPAALRAQAELAESVSATQAAGVECPDSELALADLVKQVSRLRQAITGIEKSMEPLGQRGHGGNGDTDKLAR